MEELLNNDFDKNNGVNGIWEKIRTSNNYLFNAILDNTYLRDDLLKSIDEKMINKIVGILGAPGIGKSTLSIMYACNRKYDEILFVECYKEEAMLKSLLIDEEYNNDILSYKDKIYENINSIISKDKQYLFIFDHVYLSGNDDYNEFIYNLIRDINMKFSQIDILYTTRSHKNIIHNSYIIVDDFSKEEALDYLNIGHYKCDDEYAQKVIDFSTMPIILNTIRSAAFLRGGYDEVKNFYTSLTLSKSLIDVLDSLFKELEKSESGRLMKLILQYYSLFLNDYKLSSIVEFLSCFNISEKEIIYCINKYNELFNIIHISDNHVYIKKDFKNMIRVYLLDVDFLEKLEEVLIMIMNKECNLSVNDCLKYMSMSLKIVKEHNDEEDFFNYFKNVIKTIIKH